MWQGHQAPQQGYGPGGQPPWQQGPYAPGGQPKSKKKWLIPVIAIVAILLVVGGVFGILALTGDDASGGTAVDDLSEGQCLVSADIADASDSIGDIEKVDCGDDHDAEVFATFEVGSDEAGSDFDLDAAGSTCVDEALRRRHHAGGPRGRRQRGPAAGRLRRAVGGRPGRVLHPQQRRRPAVRLRPRLRGPP